LFHSGITRYNVGDKGQSVSVQSLRNEVRCEVDDAVAVAFLRPLAAIMKFIGVKNEHIAYTCVTS